MAGSEWVGGGWVGGHSTAVRKRVAGVRARVKLDHPSVSWGHLTAVAGCGGGISPPGLEKIQ